MLKSKERQDIYSSKGLEYWLEVIKQYQESRLTQTKFCAENNIPHGAFRNWLYRLRVKGQPILETQKPLFTPIILNQDHIFPSHSMHDEHKTSQEPPLILELPDAKRIIISSGFGTDTLRRLLDVIGGETC